MKTLKKAVFNAVFILLIGGIGGVLASQIVLPYLATFSFFSQMQFIQQTNKGTTIINPTEEVIIRENTAIEDTVDKISSRLVVIRSYKNNNIISQATGFIITSDGMIITAGDIVADGRIYKIFRDNQSFDAQVAKQDKENNLVLLKIEENNLPVISFSDLDNLRLGMRVILAGAELIKDKPSYFVNLGIIRSIGESILKINLSEENILANGSPLVNIEGEVVGLNLIDEKGLIKTIPASKIKEFIGL